MLDTPIAYAIMYGDYQINRISKGSKRVESIDLNAIRYGDIANTYMEAEEICKTLVTTLTKKNTVILPRIFPIYGECELNFEVKDAAEATFQQLLERMQESHAILTAAACI